MRRSDGFAALPEFSKQDRTQRGSESMRRLLQMAAMATLATPVFAGSIVLDAPAVSGDAITFQDQPEPTRRELFRAQLQAISAWLSWNRRGWFGAKRAVSGKRYKSD